MALPTGDLADYLLAPALVAFAGVAHRAKTLHAALVDPDGDGNGDNAELTGPLADTIAVLDRLTDRLSPVRGLAGLEDALDAANNHLVAIASQLVIDAHELESGGDLLRAQLADRILILVVDVAIVTITETRASLPARQAENHE